MAGLERNEVLARIRELITEDAEDFFKDDRLIDSYNQGAWKAHRIIFRIAEDLGLLEGERVNDADYLRAFYTVTSVAQTVDGTQDYALPPDSYRIHLLTFGSAPERPARLISLSEDQRVRTSPQLGPHPEQPLFAYVPPKKARFYLAASNNGAPMSAVDFRWYYWRDLVRTGKSECVDLPEPWNEGPIHYSAAIALGKERTEASHYMSHFDACTQTVIVPPGGQR